MNGGAGRVTEAQIRRELLRENGRESCRRWRIGAAAVLAAALALGVAAAMLLATLVEIRTDAMGGALRAGDVALCLRTDAPVPLAEVRRGELVLIEYSDSGLRRLAVRRVIALAGDVVSVARDGRVTLNGQALEEAHAVYGPSEADGEEPGGALENPFAEVSDQDRTEAVHAGGMSYPFTVPEGRFFVLCDRRDDALDSRDGRIGAVDMAALRGVARAILWPAHRIGALNGA